MYLYLSLYIHIYIPYWLLAIGTIVKEMLQHIQVQSATSNSNAQSPKHGSYVVLVVAHQPYHSS